MSVRTGPGARALSGASIVWRAEFCTSEGTGHATGMLGLLMSYARDRGIELEADEAKQILTMTAYDIRDRCASVVAASSATPTGFVDSSTRPAFPFDQNVTVLCETL